MTQQQLNFDERVADRIEALLARCDRLRRGSDLRPVLFDERGEAHAAAVAKQEAERHG